MKTRNVCLTLFSTVLLTLVPAALAQSGAVDPLSGTQWQLVSFGAAGAETPAVSGAPVTLAFDSSGRVSGSAGCNRYGGSYTVEGDTLAMSELFSTRMACADSAVMQQEQSYLATLGAAAQFEQQAQQLVIDTSQGQRLIFTRVDQPTDPAPAEPFEDLTSPVALLASYYNAIDLQDYGRAYGYWETPPDPYDAFVSGFADTTSVQVIVQPPTRYDGAAGSVYVEIPTVLIAQHVNGGQATYAGCFVVRRSNIEPPDNPQAGVWHLYSADLTEVPDDAAVPALLAQACPK